MMRLRKYLFRLHDKHEVKQVDVIVSLLGYVSKKCDLIKISKLVLNNEYQISVLIFKLNY